MLGIDRRTLDVVWTMFLFALTLLVVYWIRRTLLIFAVALIFAHLLSPVVNFVDRRLPKQLPRVWSLAIVYVALLGVLVAALIPITTRISQEAASLAAHLPQVLESDPLARLPLPRSLEQFRPQVTDFVHERLSSAGEAVGPFLSEAGTRLISGLGSLLSVVLIPILAFLFLKDGTEMREAIVESVDARRRELVDHIFTDLHLLLAQYIRALVLLSLSTFSFYSAFLALASGPYPALLAGMAAALEFIPAIGPLTASVIIVIVAAATGYPHLLVIILFLAAYRMFQDFVLSPYLMSAGVAIHPMLVLFGVLAGEQLAGIPGMFFSVPAMAALRLILIRLRKRHRAA